MGAGEGAGGFGGAGVEGGAAGAAGVGAGVEGATGAGSMTGVLLFTYFAYSAMSWSKSMPASFLYPSRVKWTLS